MAGRVTHSQDWAEKEGGWEPAVTLKNGARIGLEDALGRRLTDDEIAAIERDIAPIRFSAIGFPNATAQDVKRSLGNIAKLLPDEGERAFRRSDSTTQMWIEEAIFTSPEIADKRFPPNGESITKAAAIALENLKSGKGGRPSKNLPGQYREHLATYALRLWVKLGRSDCRAWVWDDKESPIVPFLSHLASIVDDELLDWSTAVDLLKEAAKHTEISR